MEFFHKATAIPFMATRKVWYGLSVVMMLVCFGALFARGLNLAIDFALGCVPLIGDLFDAGWKANRRNLALLRRHASASPRDIRRARASDWLFVGLVGLVLLVVAAAAVAVGIWLLMTVVKAVAGLLGS